MKNQKAMHPDFEGLLGAYDESLVVLYKALRSELLGLAPECCELLYNSRVLTIAFSLSDKLSDAFCHLPIYKSHINLGFNQGAFLDDPQGILQGSGKNIRHIRITGREDFDQQTVDLVKAAIELSRHKMTNAVVTGRTILNLKL